LILVQGSLPVVARSHILSGTLIKRMLDVQIDVPGLTAVAVPIP